MMAKFSIIFGRVLKNNELYADKAYQRPDAQAIEASQRLSVLTPVKKKGYVTVKY